MSAGAVDRTRPALPDWLLALSGVGKVSGFKRVKGGAMQVTLDIATGSESYPLVLTIPARERSIYRYSIAVERAAKAMCRHLSPKQRSMFQDPDQEARDE